jgi:hypothetical protein
VDTAALPKVHALNRKRIWRVTDSRLPTVLPFKRIYMLTRDEHIAIGETNCIYPTRSAAEREIAQAVGLHWTRIQQIIKGAG